MAGLGDMWTLGLAGLICLLCVFYVWEVYRSYRRRAARTKIDLAGVEAFTNPSSSSSSEGDAAALVETFEDYRCYDKFYAKVYDALVQPGARAGMEVKLPLEWFRKQGRGAETLRIVDVGCGTGLHVDLFAKEGVKSVIGIDKSPDMIAEARRRYPEREFLVGDAAAENVGPPAESVDVATMFYFTVYVEPSRTEMLRNVYKWLAPKGLFICHAVNKLKFDPVLESASPYLGFSIQKYADERVTKSDVTFEEFDYTGDFQLHGSRGVYEEVFRFKDGRTRRHEQRVWMPNIDVLVKEITDVGFKLDRHEDLTPIGYEYQYLFFFTK
jgi:SAM-dependent methyltransferase